MIIKAAMLTNELLQKNTYLDRIQKILDCQTNRADLSRNVGSMIGVTTAHCVNSLLIKKSNSIVATIPQTQCWQDIILEALEERIGFIMMES